MATPPRAVRRGRGQRCRPGAARLRPGKPEGEGPPRPVEGAEPAPPGAGVGDRKGAGPRRALQREIRPRAVLHPPPAGRERHPVALGGVVDPILDAAGGGGTAGEEGEEREERVTRSHLPLACREASSSNTRRRGMPRALSSTMVWNHRSATSETTRASPSPPSAAVITSAASSPIFRQIWGWPFWKSEATYEPGGGATLRDSSTRSRTSNMAGPAPAAPGAPAWPASPAGTSRRVKKQLRAPVWQATPSWCTWTSSVSRAQSTEMPPPCWA